MDKVHKFVRIGLPLLVIIFASFREVFSQAVVDINVNAVSLNAARGDLYRSEKWNKAQVRSQILRLDPSKPERLAHGFSDSMLAKLPEELIFYRYDNPGKFKEGCDDCERHAVALYREFCSNAAWKSMNEEAKLRAFDDQWHRQYPSCYFYYRNFAPILDFEINLPASGRALLADVKVDLVYRSPAQASGIMKRSADADLMLPAAGLGLQSCLNKAQEGYLPYFAEQSPFVLSQLIWAESYSRTVPGKYPAKEIFILRFRFDFQVEGQGEMQVWSPYMILQV